MKQKLIFTLFTVLPLIDVQHVIVAIEIKLFLETLKQKSPVLYIKERKY